MSLNQYCTYTIIMSKENSQMQFLKMRCGDEPEIG